MYVEVINLAVDDFEDPITGALRPTPVLSPMLSSLN